MNTCIGTLTRMKSTNLAVKIYELSLWSVTIYKEDRENSFVYNLCFGLKLGLYRAQHVLVVAGLLQSTLQGKAKANATVFEGV